MCSHSCNARPAPVPMPVLLFVTSHRALARTSIRYGLRSGAVVGSPAVVTSGYLISRRIPGRPLGAVARCVMCPWPCLSVGGSGPALHCTTACHPSGRQTATPSLMPLYLDLCLSNGRLHSCATTAASMISWRLMGQPHPSREQLATSFAGPAVRARLGQCT